MVGSVIFGADDPATPPEHQRLIPATIPKRETVGPAAHLAAVEQADAVNDNLVLEHLLEPAR